MISRKTIHLLLGLVLFVPAMLSALTLAPASLDELVQESPIIVEGVVGVGHSFWGPEGNQIFTEISFQVDVIHQGDIGASEITVLEMGGIVGETMMTIDGVSNLQRNQKLLLFLRPTPDPGVYRIHSFVLGKFYLIEEAGQTMVHNAVSSGSDVNVQTKQAAQLPSYLVRPLPYSDFRTQLHSLIDRIKE